MRSKDSKNCRRKRVFATEHRARVMGSLMIPAGKQWPYECGTCGRWHLTSQALDGVAPVGPGSSGLFA